MQHEAQGQDLGQHLRGEHHHEYNLHLFLQEEFVYFRLKKKLGPSYQLDRHDRLVVVWKLVVEGHDDTVRHDGNDDDPLEGRPIDLELYIFCPEIISSAEISLKFGV